ncbi:MAG TPA: SDR family NAD(P)-dependent oxidoreductase [Ignavibacteriaceae bacterium]|nr:SDR family NAD(P)-dependent oxidoreductase [Ignavibacteriaceae bacterium]
MNSLAGKKVFITGASSGIGKSCAIAFAKEGADLILCARRIERLNQLKNELTNKYQISILPLQINVKNYSEVKAAINNIPNEWKSIDILVNNAGLARGFDKIYAANVDHWEEMIDTNVKGLLYVSREIIPLMVDLGSGHIINIGSTAGHEVYPSGNVYAATKFAVKALTQSIRLDVLDKNIRVSSVDPGMVETEFAEVRFSGDKIRAKKVYEGLEPLTPDDVAEAVLFCASRPRNVNINEIILTPLAQASSTQVIRNQ